MEPKAVLYQAVEFFNHHTFMNTLYNNGIRTLVVAAMFVSAFAFARADWNVGDPVSLSGYELTGKTLELKGKVTYVDFWASWCAPCKKSFPSIEELYLKYKDSGFQVVAVSVDGSEKAMNAFVAKAKPSFAIAHDPRQQLVAETGLEKMPTSYLIDEKGTIRYVHTGWDTKTSAGELEAHILELLSEK